jgi:diphosphomevalonate decarboxylase
MNTEQINPSGPNHFASSNSPGASLASSASKSTEATQTISGSHQLYPEPIPLLQENIPAVEGSVAWEAPSNIALIKYWGKYGQQMPANPSISFSLKACISQTKVHFQPRAGGGIRFSLSGQQNLGFQNRIEKFLSGVQPIYPWLREFELDIESANSFPHSSGIASSASGFAALALCVEQIDRQLRLAVENGANTHFPEPSTYQSDASFLKNASHLARLGSGSACRSVYGGWVQWGLHPAAPESRNEYAFPHQKGIHPVFADYRDTILLVHKGVKETGSTAGHKLMEGNPYADARYRQANDRIPRLLSILASGDVTEFGLLVESEALTLHALMMASEPSFMLMMPNTLACIREIQAFRKQNRVPVHYTLDAGANLHVLYPAEHETEVMSLINNSLMHYCENQAYICDSVGSGPRPINPLV